MKIFCFIVGIIAEYFFIYKDIVFANNFFESFNMFNCQRS